MFWSSPFHSFWLISTSLFLSVGFVVLFISLRMRDAQAEVKDPQLGFKTILYFFCNLSILQVLAGLTMLVENINEVIFDPVALMNGPMGGPGFGGPRTPFGISTTWLNAMQRFAIGLIVSGLMHTVLFFAAIRYFTNDREFPAVNRAFMALRLFIAIQTVFWTTTVAVIHTISADNFDYVLFLRLLSVSMVWWPVTVLHFYLVIKTKKSRTTTASAKPA